MTTPLASPKWLRKHKAHIDANKHCEIIFTLQDGTPLKATFFAWDDEHFYSQQKNAIAYIQRNYDSAIKNITVMNKYLFE